MPSPPETIMFADDPAGFVLGYLDKLAWMDAELVAFSKHGDLASFSSHRSQFTETMRAFDDVWRAYVVRRSSEMAEDGNLTMAPLPARRPVEEF